MAVREKKITSRNLRKIVKELATIPDEIRRFRRLTATSDTIMLIVANPDVYEMVINMLTGYNRFVLEASFEANTKKRYKMVQKVVCELNTLQFAVLSNVFPVQEYLLLLKERCNICNDNAACTRFNQVVYGEPEAEDDDDDVAKLGLMGMWTIEDNRQSGEILVAVGAITQEEYDATIAERDGVKTPPVEPPTQPVEVTPTPPPAPPEPLTPQVEVTPTPPPEPPIPQVEVTPTPPPAPPEPPIPQVEDLTSLKKSIEERMEQLKQEEIIINLKIQLEEERRKRKDLEKSIGRPGGDSPLVVKESRIPLSALSVVYMRPEDYEKWGFVDFEGIIPGLKFEDLQILFDHVGLSQKMNEQEKDTIREIITKRTNNLTHKGV